LGNYRTGDLRGALFFLPASIPANGKTATRKKFMKSLSLIFLLASTAFAAGPVTQERVGRFYELGTEPKGKPLFLQRTKRVTKENGERASDSTIEDSEGQVVMRESATLKGAEILTQRMDQLQIGESYELERKNGKIFFRTYRIKEVDKREFVSEKSIEPEKNFITGPSSEPFLKARLSGHEEGAAVEAEFGIFELEKPVLFSFTLKKLMDEKKIARIKMQAASFWVSLLVPYIEMDFDTSTYQLVRYSGRTPLRLKQNGNLKPFDSLIVYSDK
jgi:hypothetical protein